MKSESQFKTQPSAKPFIKWAGGKRALLPELMKRLPKVFNDYYEPFLGGGALFYEVQRSRVFDHAHLSDMNAELIAAYKIIQSQPRQLIAMLNEHKKNHSETYFYDIRSMQHLTDPLEIAARFIYLNKTCFNGLYRVNKSGEFNAPFGKYKNPKIADADNIMACSTAFSENCDFAVSSYDVIEPQKGDFVYLDPPYYPINDTSFTSYSKNGFAEQDHIDLAGFFRKADKYKARIMMSNSDTPFVRALYKEFNIQTVQAPRRINCKGNQRADVSELIITNYSY